MRETLWEHAEGCIKYTVVNDGNKELPFAVYSSNRIVARACSELMAEDFARLQIADATRDAPQE